MKFHTRFHGKTSPLHGQVFISQFHCPRKATKRSSEFLYGEIKGQTSGFWYGEGRGERSCTVKAIEAKSRQISKAPATGDEDLWAVLDMCTDEELETVHNALYGASMMSPLVKSLVADNEPSAISWRGRSTIMQRIDTRFRFLAADALSTIQGKRPSYRETLICVRDRMHIQCPQYLATQDLESEIFLHLLQRQSEAMQGLADSLDPTQAKISSKQRSVGDIVGEKLGDFVNKFKLGAPEMGESVLKFASIMSVNSLRQTTLQQLARHLVMQRMRYQAALKVVCKTGTPVIQREATLKAAQAGLTSAAARYGAARGALGMIGPVMWAWLATDLALNSIGTDFQRITKAIYLLAQVRLTRTKGFINPSYDEHDVSVV